MGIKNLEVEKKLKEDALEFAVRAHKGQYRKDGTQYINHPIRVANNVQAYKESKKLDMLMACAYLHDTVEDTDATYYDIVDKFGPQVGSIVMELTTDEDMKNALGKTQYLSLKMKNMSSWALVLKLCDRLDNVSDLANADEGFREKYTKETLAILNYLEKNRELSNTHKNLIHSIYDKLAETEILCPQPKIIVK